MSNFYSKTFGGLNSSYYWRNFLFGLLAFAFMIFTMSQAKGISAFAQIVCTIIFLVNSFLYPYARYVYESVFNYILGDNVFYVSAKFAIPMKISMMFVCWFLAILIAPFGLIYLYYHHSKS